MNKANTRVAPSPTGDMHIGTARTAYFNWLIARITGGEFLLRIDDTDTKRNTDQAYDVIMRTMDWLRLDYDELVYQSDRFGRYLECAKGLVGTNKAYEEDGCIKLHLPTAIIPSFWHDTIAGNVPITNQDLTNMHGLVLIRSDQTPTYHFATVVDDIDFGTNWIIRGKDHISNTAKHVAIYCQIREKLPAYTHLGLITQNGKKISKRDASSSMLNYQQEGIHPDAMLNFLLRMGWGPKVDDKSTAVISRERALELFLDGGSMKNSDAGYDRAKLDSFNRKYQAAERKAA
jgi:glutamyl/glutaminyl-tRNA synthetase